MASIYDQIANVGRGFNPLGAFMQGRSIQQEQQRNALAQRIAEEKRIKEEQASQAEIDKRNKLMALAGQVAGGDRNALAQMAAIDPGYTQNFKKAIGTGQTMPFEGTGMDAQVYNSLIGYNQKKAQGLPTTQQEDMAYNLVYQRASKPQYITTADGRQFELPGMDLSGFVRPGGGMQQPIQQPQQGIPQQRYGLRGGIEIGSKDLPKFRQAAGNLSTFTASAKDLMDEIKRGGAELIPGSERYGKLQGMHTDLVMQAKNLYELGALQAPDVALIERLLPDPTSLQSGIKSTLFGPQEMLGKLNALRPVIERGKKSLEQKYGFDITKDFGKFPTFNGGTQSKQRQSGPKIGQEENGYIYLGGDPANPKSWKKAR